MLSELKPCQILKKVRRTPKRPSHSREIFDQEVTSREIVFLSIATMVSCGTDTTRFWDAIINRHQGTASQRTYFYSGAI
jgi:hypothetical protein